MARERFVNREGNRRRELELSRYSPALSHKILTMEGKSSLSPAVPEVMLASFQKGSLLDRDSYWKKKTPDSNFGQQMMFWIGAEPGEDGMIQWLQKQNDPDVVGLLQEVGLTGTPESAQAGLKEKKVTSLLEVINTDLEDADEEPIEIDDLLNPDNEPAARALIFYATYLNAGGEKKPHDTRSLVDTLVGAAIAQSSTSEEAINKLQKITPLLRVAGEEGQDVLGALLVAKAHAVSSSEALQQIAPDAQLREDEQRVLDFLRRHREYEKPDALEEGKEKNLRDELEHLSPDAVPGHPYFVDKDIPDNFAATRSPDQIQSLQLRKTFWNREGNTVHLNREVFEPAFVLKDDGRFTNAEALTNNDSGLFALAAASAATPEKQVALYRALGETVLRVHEDNPRLLEEFLSAQTEGSLNEFLAHDYNRTMPRFNKQQQEFGSNLRREFEQRFGTYDSNAVTAEQQQFIEGKTTSDAPKLGDMLANFSLYPDRLLSMHLVPTDPNALEQFPLAVDAEKTVAAWPNRITALKEALQKDQVTLTVEQLRQIEFLSHSVNVPKIIEWLQTEQTVPVAAEVAPEPLPAPVVQGTEKNIRPEETRKVEAAPIQERAEELEKSLVASISLSDFFEQFGDIEASLPEGVEGQRQELRIDDSSHLAEFSTEHEDIGRYEIVDNTNKLALFTFETRDDGLVIPGYNMRDPFVGTLLKDNSLSVYAFLQLAQMGFQQNTLLAYTFEAAATPEERATLMKNLFVQIAKMYGEHDSVRGQMEEYMTELSSKSPLEEENSQEVRDRISRLFGSTEQTSARLEELRKKLEEGSQLTLRDFGDMGTYALPFNLQTVANRMRLAYRMREASASAPEVSPQAE